MATASALFEAPIFARIAVMCSRTTVGDMFRASAMSLLVSPFAIYETMYCCRSVRTGTGGDCLSI